MKYPLDGVKVLDLTRLLPGAFCTMFLADFGAEVLKVEDTIQGDYMRFIPPYVDNEGVQFMALNRNKKSMKLNLKKNEGKEILKKLVKQYDVLIEGFRPGVMERLGVGYETLKKENPELIYCAITGYGQNGPYKDKAGHDNNYISLAGILDLSGKSGGEASLLPVQVADLGGGALMAAIGVLTAIIGREKSGTGSFIDISMQDGALSWMSAVVAKYLADKELPLRGELYLNGALLAYDVYPAKDGRFMSLGALEPKFWETFCKAINRMDILPEFMAAGERKKQLHDELRAIFQSKTQSEWVEFFKGMEVCCEPVKTMPEVLEDAHLKERNMFIDVPSPSGVPVKEVNNPIKFSNIPDIIKKPSPRFGEHTQEVLKALGYNEEQVRAFENEGVI